MLEDISNTNFNERLSVDESKFTSEGNENIWVIGVINNCTKQFRLEISKIRNSNVLKKFIFAYVKPGNIIVSDWWAGYDFLSENNSPYVHSVHNHGHGDFGIGLDSTSHIEQLWSQLKSTISKIYTIIPSKNFYLYLKEAEFRLKIKNLSNKEKIIELIDIFNYIRNINLIDLYNYNYLIKFAEI